ncbi:MAG: hypothetical protein Q9183_007496, partial [Haloplaca sp. 2 TL-2023]
YGQQGYQQLQYSVGMQYGQQGYQQPPQYPVGMQYDQQGYQQPQYPVGMYAIGQYPPMQSQISPAQQLEVERLRAVRSIFDCLNRILTPDHPASTFVSGTPQPLHTLSGTYSPSFSHSPPSSVAAAVPTAPTHQADTGPSPSVASAAVPTAPTHDADTGPSPLVASAAVPTTPAQTTDEGPPTKPEKKQRYSIKPIRLAAIQKKRANKLTYSPSHESTKPSVERGSQRITEVSPESVHERPSKRSRRS